MTKPLRTISLEVGSPPCRRCNARVYAGIVLATALVCGNVAFADGKDAEPPLSDERCKALIRQTLSPTLERRKATFHGYMAATVRDLERTTELSDAQVRRFEIAAKGAVDRFVDRWLDACTTWSLNRIRKSGRTVDEKTIKQYANPSTFDHYDTMAGAHRIRESISRESIWAQTLVDLLSQPERENYEQVLRRRVTERREANIRFLLATVDQEILLSDSQRKQMHQLLDEAIGARKLIAPVGHYGHMLLMGTLSRIPNDKINTLLDEQQMKIWKQSNATYARYANFNVRQLLGPWSELIAPVEDAKPKADKTD